jgi:hypothetical protein
MTHQIPECFKEKQIALCVTISKCSTCDYTWKCKNAFKDDVK